MQNYSRRQLLVLLSQLSAAVALSRCKRSALDNASSTKDLVNLTGATTVDEDRIDTIIEKFNVNNWFQSDNANFKNTVIRELTAVPDEYLKFLDQRNKYNGFHFKETSLGGYAGLCYFDAYGATIIELAPGMAEFATLHEVGHGVETYALNAQNLSSKDLQLTFTNVIQSYESAQIRSYSRTNHKELWADAFSTMYRSKNSRAVLKKLPKIKAFLAKALIEPPNLALSENFDNFIKDNNLEDSSQITGTIASKDKSSLDADPKVAKECANSNSEIAKFICELMQELVETSQGTSLTSSSSQFIIPVAEQVFHSEEDIHILAKFTKLSAKELQDARLSLNGKVLAKGLKPENTTKSSTIYSAKVRVPRDMTQLHKEKPAKLEIIVGGRVVEAVDLRLNRFPRCENLRDLG